MISVVCVMYNNASTVDALVRSMATQGDSISEAVFVDNGSRDSTVAMCNEAIRSLPFPATVVEGENVGFAAGIDVGLEGLRSDGPILVVNPDVVLRKGIVAEMEALLDAQPTASVVTAPLTLLSGDEDSASRRALPRLGASAIYAGLGKLTPARFRYNRRLPADVMADESTALPYSVVEATTGALMMISPTFRNRSTGIFDRSYWMYGEDLQLCADAADSGRRVLMLERPGSVHSKGTSSGFPRSATADRAFHEALYLYYSKNLRRSLLEARAVKSAVTVRYLWSRAMARCSGHGRPRLIKR